MKYVQQIDRAKRRPSVWINVYAFCQKTSLQWRAAWDTREKAEENASSTHRPLYRIRVRLK